MFAFDLVNLVIGVVVGMVLTTSIPVLFSWTKKQIASFEADIKALEAVVADKKAATPVANTAAPVVAKVA
jgi:hypothetical protein